MEKKYNKKTIIELLIISVLSIYICIFLAGCKNDEKKELKDKVISELGYLNQKIINILNDLNNLSFESYSLTFEQIDIENKNQSQQSAENNKSENSSSSNENSKEQTGSQQTDEDLINTTKMIPNTVLTKDKNSINWQKIESEIESLNESWSIIILDLYGLNVKNDTILDFSSKLNTALITIKNNEKQETLIALADLYASIPQFLQDTGSEEYLKKIRITQSYVINAYSLAEDIYNSEINVNIQKAIEVFGEVINDLDYTKDKSYKTNKVYILLNELANAIKTKDKDVFYLKYIGFMREINEL